MSYWFRPKRYGYGATPSNWKGWLAAAAFAALAVILATVLEPGRGGSQSTLVFYGVLIAAIVLFVWVARKKTDGPWRWRWGSGEKEK